MIIKELTLHNFGVYASTNKFSFTGNKPIVLVGGMNGRGKTTFLESILLALYGPNSFAYNESKNKTYGQYLRSYVNAADGTMISYIDLVFSMDAETEEIYRIHREWDGSKKRIAEQISVYKDGVYNQFLTDNWTMFIENILPSGLSNFFFFDGEKIAELAVENTSTQMKESIKTLLGISVLDSLNSDLMRIISRATKNKAIDSEASLIEEYRLKKDEAVEKLEHVNQELLQMEQSKNELLQKLDSLRQDYSAKGGDIVTQKQELFQKRTHLVSKYDTIKEQLVYDAASELPLILVKNLLRNIRENGEIEQEEKMLDVALRKVNRIAKKYKLSNEEDASAVERFMDYMAKTAQKSNLSYSYHMSDNSLFRLQNLLDEQLTQTKLDISNRQEALKQSQKEIDQIDSYLSVDIDEQAITNIYRDIKKTETELVDLDIAMERKREERSSCNGEVIATTSLFTKTVEAYLKRQELNDDGDRIIKYSHMAEQILSEYKVRLQKNKITVVAETMTACYKKLANKKNLIERIEMDPVTLDLVYLNADHVAVDRSSLSAGEKQLMVIALLWALALCSKKKLPVIIDTPLSRLDSAHRLSLIQTYFPQASEQTIILSTDSEIDKNYYEIMKENVGDEFTLVYDDLSKSTSIRSGYFTEE